MPMIVRELIEHLAQQDQNAVVKLRLAPHDHRVRDVPNHGVSVEDYVDGPDREVAPTAVELRQMLKTGEAKIISIVAIG